MSRLEPPRCSKLNSSFSIMKSVKVETVDLSDNLICEVGLKRGKL